MIKLVLTIVQAGIPCKWANDSQRLLLEHFDTIYDSPSQLYHSALPLCPISSWLQRQYSAELSAEVKVVEGLPAKWGKCSRTISFEDHPCSLAYWDNTIAVGLSYGDIIIMNAFTGSHTAIFSGHTYSVCSLTFSSNGVLLVSGSYDKSIKLWDVQTGGIIKTFSGSASGVQSVSISVDSTLLAAGLVNGRTYLQNIRTGECHNIIEKHRFTPCVRFSPTEPQHFTTIYGNEVQEWDINGNQIGQAYTGQYIAFSLDSTQFALCNDGVVTVQKSESREIIAKFHVTAGRNCCCFSPDGKLIAVVSGTTIYIWDITSPDPHLIETFIGHADTINGIMFSSTSSFISTSSDSSVRFWQIGTSLTDQIEDNQETVSNPSTPLTITLQAKDGVTITSHEDGMVRIWDISTGLCKASFQTPAKPTAGASKRGAQLVNGRVTFVWHEDEKISIWDAEKGELLSAIPLPGLASEFLTDIRISGDGLKVFCCGFQWLQAFSMQTGEVISEVQAEEGQEFAGILAVDGSRVWVNFFLPGWKGWDFGVPRTSPVKLLTTPPGNLHSNGTIVWDISMCRVQDTVTGSVLFQLAKGFGKPDDVGWNDQHLFACFKSGKTLIFDFSHIIPQ